MANAIDDNQGKMPDEALRHFVDAQLLGEEPDIDEFVKQYPGFEHQIRQKIENLKKIDTLFASLMETDDSEFEDTADGQNLVGKKLGDFEIIKMIGRGGMGVVYLAHDTRLHRFVVIKSLPAGAIDDSRVRSRWEREAQLLATLNHPYIATIYDIIKQADGAGFLVLEYVSGETLAERIEHGALLLKEALSIGLQIAEALVAAHSKGVIHRDLKPGNIKLTAKGRVKVLDFGLAKKIAAEPLDQKSTAVTQVGQIVGTPSYMSPEQALGKPTDHRSDIWSFGCVLYEMITGSRAFLGETTPDVMELILTSEPDWQLLPEQVPAVLRDIIHKCLEKDPEQRYQSATELYQDLMEYHTVLSLPAPKALDFRVLLQSLRKPRITIVCVAGFLMFCVIVLWLISRSSKMRWARVEAIPEIIRLIEQDKYLSAYSLARKAEKYIPNDSILIKLWPRICRDFSIITTPPVAEVFFKDYLDIDGSWQYLGRSPLEKIKFPRGVYRWRIMKEGFENRECLGGGWTEFGEPLSIDLWKKGDVPPGMVKLRGDTLKVRLSYYEHVTAIKTPEYYIDKYEVTNEQFKQFVDDGGYQNQQYWKYKFVRDGQDLSWDEAMGEFRDKTGRQGPSAWEGGTYAKGQEKYPVCGVSWYEAAAYSEFAGKCLPTIYHWSSAACIQEAIAIISLSNFSGSGPARVGSYPAIGSTGLYDMGGNVREWCYNSRDAKGQIRYILGGAWNQPTYMFTDADARSPWDRSEINGFRCVRYPSRQEAVSEDAFYPIEFPSVRDYSKETPASNEEFLLYKESYAYDATELNAVIEEIDDNSEYWRREKITFDAAYGRERMIAYLYLPKAGKAPYQTVVYFPGAGALRDRSFGTLPQSPFTEFVIMSGRALIFPVFKGTYERRFIEGFPSAVDMPNAYREWVFQLSKDLGRSIDYLETRDDIDCEKIAYYGLSWGARIGPIMLAVEKRPKVAVFFLGGFHLFDKPAVVDEFNFAPQVKTPVLMINGREDSLFPYKTSQIPMYEFLGTDEAHKQHKLYPGGHGLLGLFSRQIREDVLNWLDYYLGPVD